MNGYKLVLDISHYHYLNYDLVCEQVDGFIVRAAFGQYKDARFETHYSEIAARGKPIAVYQWFRPDQSVTAQIEVMKLALENKKIRVIFSDQEQHGLYFNGGSMIPFYSPAALSELCRSHVTGLALHGYEVGTYTRGTWVMERCQPSLAWRYEYPVWLASWPYAQGAYTCSWNEFKSTWLPKTFSPFYPSGWPVEKRFADAWQFTGDKFILPGINTSTGVNRSVDVNFVSDALFARFTDAPVIPPAPDSAELIKTVYDELSDLKTRMQTNLAGELVELDYIMGLLKPE